MHFLRRTYQARPQVEREQGPADPTALPRQYPERVEPVTCLTDQTGDIADSCMGGVWASGTQSV